MEAKSIGLSVSHTVFWNDWNQPICLPELLSTGLQNVLCIHMICIVMSQRTKGPTL